MTYMDYTSTFQNEWWGFSFTFSAYHNLFVKKIVNTRNNITHPKEQKLPAFSAVEYDNASYLLTKVIRAYLLNTLSFNSEIIKKIITF